MIKLDVPNWLLGLMLVGFAAFLVIRTKSRKNDLAGHLEAEQELQDINSIVNMLDLNALENYPLSTVGDTPLAGIHLDPFNPDNTAATVKRIDLYRSLPS